MKFGEFIERCQKLAEERPEVLDFEMVRGIDEDCYIFDGIFDGPIVGHFTGYHSREFYSEEKIADPLEELDQTLKPNAINID